jgi:predicted nuclease of predicted toxin-antitoxin system
VRILLDECIDWRLSRAIRGHDVQSVRQAGWTGTKNGELLALASERFDVFITVDRNLSFQQNVTELRIAVIVLRARTNRLSELLPLVPNILSVLDAAEPGVVTLVGG